MNQGDFVASARNDPCPCGSGKKYKHCCLRRDDAPPVDPKTHAGAPKTAIDWLFAHHRKAMLAAFDRLQEELLAPEDMVIFSGLDDETLTGIQINLTEWLLAQGEILVQGVSRRVPDYLLGPSGPLLTVGQRDWLRQLAQRPLRLYDITDVEPGARMTLCDTLNGDAAPLVVQEKSGTRALAPGMLMGCRVMRVGEHHELSGAIYSFSMLAGQALASALRATADEFGRLPELASTQGMAVMAAWIRQYLAPAPMPMLMDAYSGEPLLLVTDHYRVLDWPGLTCALDQCAEALGDREHGWDRLMDCEDGQTRALANIDPGKTNDRVEVCYRTQAYADNGRAWFDGLAGAAVAFVTREVSDLRSLTARGGKSAAIPAMGARMPDLDPQELSEAVEGLIRRNYAHWADEPIPALGDKTPRQAIQTAGGLERVKGLLRSYEAGEKVQAARQGRAEVSYNFLWEAIGVSRRWCAW